MIRRATEADTPALVEMGKHFHEASGWGALSEFNPESFTVTVKNLMSGALDGGIYVAGSVGMAAFLIYPLYFNSAVRVGQEVFWWIEPEHRYGLGGELVTAMENDARKAGAAVFMLAALPGLREMALARLYARRGYRAAENTYLKRL